MAMGEFQETHAITVVEGGRARVFRVSIDGDGPGPAYTRSEWEAGASADWELDEGGAWTFKGRAHPSTGDVWVTPIADLIQAPPGNMATDAQVASASALYARGLDITFRKPTVIWPHNDGDTKNENLFLAYEYLDKWRKYEVAPDGRVRRYGHDWAGRWFSLDEVLVDD